MLAAEAYLPIEAGCRRIVNHRVRVGGQRVVTRLQRCGDLARKPGESEAVADVVQHLAAHDQLEAPGYRSGVCRAAES